jgi:hypothetical protein
VSYLARVRLRRRSPASAPTRGRIAGLPLPLPLLSSPSPSPLLSLSLSYLQAAFARTPASVRADPRTHPRPRLYNPRPHLIFLLFLSLPLVGVVGFAWQRPERGYCASVERGVGILRAGSRNYCQSFLNIEILLKIEISMAIFSRKNIFGESWDLLPWMRKTLQPSSMEDTQ